MAINNRRGGRAGVCVYVSGAGEKKKEKDVVGGQKHTVAAFYESAGTSVNKAPLHVSPQRRA